MSDLLITGSNAVRNSQLALNVVSNNIANVNTEGYVKQSVNYAESPSTLVGALSIGTGAIADGISRAYDGLVENALRTSESDLKSKETMLAQTNKLIDFLGDEKASLTPALGAFFDSIKSLANDASSAVRRDQLIGSGRALASRFNEISAQLTSFEEDTRNALKLKTEQANELVSELGLVNNKLIRIQDLAKQPPELLNLRDRLLADLSKFVKTSIVEKENGSFDLHIESIGSPIVDRREVGQLQVRDSASEPDKVEIFQSTVEGDSRLTRPGGEITGLIDFRERVLYPLSTGLELIASTFLDNVNEVHRSGIDLLGQKGKDLFIAEPSVEVSLPDETGRLGFTLDTSNFARTSSQSYEIEFDSEKNMWKGRTAAGDLILSHGDSGVITLDGLRLSLEGKAREGDVVRIIIKSDVAASIRMGISDNRLLAAANSHSLVARSSNLGDAKANLSIEPKSASSYLPNLSALVENNLDTSERAIFPTSSSEALFSVPAGSEGVRLKLHDEFNTDSELQIFTRGGAHLFGTALDEDEISGFLQERNSFYKDVSYDSNYLNGGRTEVRVDLRDLSRTTGALTINGEQVSQENPVPSAEELVELVNAASENTRVVASIGNDGIFVLQNIDGREANEIVLGPEPNVLGVISGAQGPNKYLNNDWRAGVFGSSFFETGADLERFLRNEAQITGGNIPELFNETDDELVVIPDGALNLNGYSMEGLTLQAGENLTPEGVLAWFNRNIEQTDVPVKAALFTEVLIRPGDLSTTTGQLEINGIALGADEPFGNLGELAAVINQGSQDTGVEAQIRADGAMALRNLGFENRDLPINFGEGESALPDIVGVRNSSLEITYDRADGDTADYEIALTLGQNGGFSDLRKLGLSGIIDFEGILEEDLIVFASGQESARAEITAEYSLSTNESPSLLQRELTLEFVADDLYRFSDKLSNTVLSERVYRAGEEIEFQGLKIEIDGNPRAGDIFTVAPQESGQGDTSNLKRLSQLESAKVVQGAESLHDKYLSILGRAGNLSKQADVAREAYLVLRNQAEERREALSGVNLDEEAGNLIRFQQSYQASARLVRTANELFETIVRL